MRTIEQIQLYVANANVSLADYWAQYLQAKADGDPDTGFMGRRIGIIKLYLFTIQSYIDNEPTDVKTINSLFNSLLSYLPSDFFLSDYTFYNPLATNISGAVVISAAAKASNTIYGIVRLNVAPLLESDPVALGANDPRIAIWDSAYTLAEDAFNNRITSSVFNSLGQLVLTKADASTVTSTNKAILSQSDSAQTADFWISGQARAGEFVVDGGLSTQFLKANGTLDSNTYLTGNQTITLSGEAIGSGATAISVTLSNAAVIGKVLTGYVSGAGTITASDSILSAIQKLNGNIGALVTGVSSVFGRTGAVTAQSGDYTTAQVTESGNLYFTNARARGAISLTIIGNSGASTYDNVTGVLNIPTYTLAGLGGVPYTGATTNVDLGEYYIKAGYFAYDITPSVIPTDQGATYWDDAEETVAIIMNGALQHVGLDSFYNAKNSTGSTISKGTAVRFAGTDGGSGHILIAPMLADGTYPSMYYMGITAEDIANGEFGKVMQFGKMRGVNTSTFANGNILYVSTTVAGAFQTTAPTAPNNIIVAASVIHAANNGTLAVRATLGSNINTDEGVKITSPTTGQLLQLQANGLWENKTKAQVLGGTSSQFVKGDGSLDSNVYLTGNQTITISGEASGNGATSISLTLDNTAVISKVLTGLNLTGGGTIVATDNILQAFGKVQNQISALVGGVMYQGVWNASTNTPTLTSSVGTKGYYYIVNVAGTTNLNGITDWQVGDWAIFNGTTWDKVDNTDAVSSVNGFTGAVSLTTANIPEVTNLYFTQLRARQSISETITGIDYDSNTGVFSLTSGYVIPTTTSASEWDTAYSSRIATFTTTGNSGSATFSGNTLNIPTYTLAGLGGQPLNTNLTSLSNLAYSSLAFVKMTASGTFALDTNTYATASSISGTTGKLAKFTASGTIGDSVITETSGNIFINAASGTYKFEVNSGNLNYLNARFYGSENAYLLLESTTAARQAFVGYKSPTRTWLAGLQTDGSFIFFDDIAQATRIKIDTNGQIITNNATNTGEHFIVGGSARVNGTMLVTGAATFSSSIAIGNTVQTSVATASTHKVTMVIGGVTYYLLATNV